jgi:hypothetical protein
MKINNWIKSEYVMFIGIALLSFVWRVCPSEKKSEGKPPGFGFPVHILPFPTNKQNHRFSQWF